MARGETREIRSGAMNKSALLIIKSQRVLPAAFALCLSIAPLRCAEKGWTELFNGKDLTGWRVNENAETFSIQDGAIVAHGKRSHCFYVGDVGNHAFKNFELKVDVKTLPNSNGGI